MRSCPQTKNRIRLLTKLVAEFGRRDLTIKDACEFLMMTDAGAKKYLRDLKNVDLIIAGNRETAQQGRPELVYHLTADKQDVAKFLSDIAKGILPSRHMVKPAAQEVRLPRAPFRHPMDIAFFGPAGAHA